MRIGLEKIDSQYSGPREFSKALKALKAFSYVFGVERMTALIIVTQFGHVDSGAIAMTAIRWLIWRARSEKRINIF